MTAPQTQQTPMKTTDTDLGVTSPETVVKSLNRLLADEFVLYTKTRNYHWNVTGPRFYTLHQLFEKQYKELEAFIDDVAERARTLGGVALGSLSEMIQVARLTETPVGEGTPTADTMIQNLVNDHDALVNNLRKDAKRVIDENHDEGTNGLYADIIASHEKMAWMLRAHLEDGV